MYEFNYHRATSLESAAEIYSQSEDPVYLAGGMTLIPTLKQRLAKPSDVIDLSGVDGLSDVKQSAETLTIGSMTTHAAVAANSVVSSIIPALSALAGGIGDPHVRNKGTLGGSVANNDPSADYPAALVGLDAIVITNQREIPAEEFFIGMFETSLVEGELISHVRFNIPDKAAYMKFANPASRYAIVGVMVAKFPGEVRVAITGAGPAVFRSGEMEQALASQFSIGAIDGVKVAPDELNSDIHAGQEYRANLVSVMAARAVEMCG
ncbi:MAG: carbon monoxide dehydrogenase [Rhodospirillaceae bacterium]|nr:carbon monoxide dehydrogenase [Rhodospirillaceae bacterium]